MADDSTLVCEKLDDLFEGVLWNVSQTGKFLFLYVEVNIFYKNRYTFIFDWG